jgi:hypothetical protein
VLTTVFVGSGVRGPEAAVNDVNQRVELMASDAKWYPPSTVSYPL